MVARTRPRGPRGRSPRRGPATAGRSGRRRSSQDPQLLELLDGLEERARPDRVEQRAADVGKPGGRRLAVAPAEGDGVERERRRPLAQRLLLVAEDRRCEDVEVAVLAALRRIRVVEARRGLEDEPARAAAANEVRELLHRRDALAAATDLRAQPACRNLVERHALEVDGVVLAL